MENRPVTDHLPIKDIDKLTNDDFPVRYCVSWPEGFHLVWWLNPLMFHHFHSFSTIFIGSILISVAFLWHLGRRILKDRPESSVVVTEARDRAGVAWGWREGSGFPHENMGFRWFQQQHMVWIYVFFNQEDTWEFTSFKYSNSSMRDPRRHHVRRGDDSKSWEVESSWGTWIDIIITIERIGIELAVTSGNRYNWYGWMLGGFNLFLIILHLCPEAAN